MKKRLRTQSTLNHKPPRLLSFMIAVLLLFGAVSPSVSFALDGYRTDTQDGTDGSVSSESEALSLSGEITYTEIEEKRDAFTKHFKRSDGKYVAVLYSEPVHTVKDGQYVNLDNRLIETANGRYETVNDAFRVSFAKK